MQIVFIVGDSEGSASPAHGHTVLARLSKTILHFSWWLEGLVAQADRQADSLRLELYISHTVADAGGTGDFACRGAGNFACRRLSGGALPGAYAAA
jgi:hypothetical protein